MFLHNGPSDVSLLHAGRDIWYADVKVAGPGLLDVVAGRNLVQEDRASIVSVGPALRGDKRPGADIAITAGAGSAGPDYDALGKRYLDPANRAVAGQTLTSQPGKVVHTYERELADWLRARDGFTGSDQDVLARFETLPLALRQAFLRSVYFAELRAGGREYNDAQGPRRVHTCAAARPSRRCSRKARRARAASRCSDRPACVASAAARSRRWRPAARSWWACRAWRRRAARA